VIALLKWIDRRCLFHLGIVADSPYEGDAWAALPVAAKARYVWSLLWATVYALVIWAFETVNPKLAARVLEETLDE